VAVPCNVASLKAVIVTAPAVALVYVVLAIPSDMVAVAKLLSSSRSL